MIFVNGNSQENIPEQSDKGMVLEIHPDFYMQKLYSQPYGITNNSLNKILANLEIYLKQARLKNQDFPNKYTARLYNLFTLNDLISRMRYGYGVSILPCQKNIPELIEYIIESRWYREFLIPVTSKSTYDYAENISVRIVLSSFTAAYFFNIPYPTLICLLFQESKFDFKVRSFTGALGLGQLTSIGVRQLSLLRQKQEEEKRLQDAAAQLTFIYKDLFMRAVLNKMGFTPVFPDLGYFPQKIERYQIVDDIMRVDVAAELQRMGHTWANDFKLVSDLIDKEFRGHVPRGKYAALHGVTLRITEHYFGNKFGNIFNIETNVLACAMLLRHYLDYPWKINDIRLKFEPSVRGLLAVAAYNQGPKPVKKWLHYIKRQFPGFNFNTMTPADFVRLFSKKTVQAAYGRRSSRGREMVKHVKKLNSCSHR